ncbi:hypothetical protein [Leptospira sarikeiensis]|uniref:Uncharacterized protein n=1 Tax=Leptospira sarikeiensis TaxID=2484943 RepID=A0A4R9K722_9LEPT|nr:hypothetical protein [Leptospira sarikeiensis]TGL61170.1 hypothetical protein EHQ64_11175 [Leptospira sarikeiensis]
MDLKISEEYCSSMLEQLHLAITKELAEKSFSTICDGELHRSVFCGKFADPAGDIIIKQHKEKNINDDEIRYLDIILRFYKNSIFCNQEDSSENL